MSFFNTLGRSIGNRRPKKSPTSDRFPGNAFGTYSSNGYNSPGLSPQSAGAGVGGKQRLFLCQPFVRTHLVKEFCTSQRCPTMNGGPGYDFAWMDNQRKHIRLPAPAYIDYATSWINNLMTDETVFPTKAGRDFPPNFIYTVKHFSRQMMRIFCHIYHHHFEQIVHLCLEGHLNSLFCHFISFANEFDLLERKDVEPLMPLIEIFAQNNHVSWH